MTLPLKAAFAEIRKLADDGERDLYFWYCPEGADGQPILLLHKKPVATSDINEARKGAKSSKSCKGRIGLADKALKLRVAGTAPGKMDKAVRTIAADHGLRVPEVVIVEGPEESEQDPQQQPPLAPVDPEREKFERALGRVKPLIEHLKTQPAKRAQFADLMQDMQDKVARGRWADARAVLVPLARLAQASDEDLQGEREAFAQQQQVTDEQMSRWSDEDSTWRQKVKLDTYSVDKRVGSGGMGAIALLKSTARGAPPLVLKTGQGLDVEAKMYQAIGPHPNIARCLGIQDVGTSRGLVMEAVGGGDMSQALAEMNELRKAGQLKDEEYWGVVQFSMKRTLEALAFMQQKGLVHRDVKPPNIMFDEETGEPKLIDMGIGGKLDEDGEGMTLGYTPLSDEEIADPKNLQSRRDPFAVGASLFEVTRGNTGRTGDGAQQKEEQKERFDYGKQGEEPWFIAADRFFKDKSGTALKVSDDGAQVFDKDEKGNAVKKRAMYGAQSSYVEFVNWLMHPDPTKRPTPAEALSHPFLQQSLLGDDQAKSTVKKLIQRRKGGEGDGPPDPQQAHQRLAELMKTVDLVQAGHDGGKRAAQVAKLAQALLQRIAKPGVALLGEEVARQAQVADELDGQAEVLRLQREKWSEAARQLGQAVTGLKPGDDKALAKQLAGDQKLLLTVSDAARAAQDALLAMQQAAQSLREAVAKARPLARPVWQAGDLRLTAEAWEAMKKQAIAHGLKDEATGMTPALTALDKLRKEYRSKPSEKLKAGLRLALDKTERKLLDLVPVNTFGGAHAGMHAYRQALLQAVARERSELG